MCALMGQQCTPIREALAAAAVVWSLGLVRKHVALEAGYAGEARVTQGALVRPFL